MKDHETLTTHHVKDGMTVHLVIKQSGGSSSGSPAGAAPATSPTPTTQSSTQAQSPPNIQASPFGLGGFGGIPGLGNLGMGSANFMEMQQRMQRDLMSNPDMLRQVNYPSGGNVSRTISSKIITCDRNLLSSCHYQDGLLLFTTELLSNIKIISTTSFWGNFLIVAPLISSNLKECLQIYENCLPISYFTSWSPFYPDLWCFLKEINNN